MISVGDYHEDYSCAKDPPLRACSIQRVRTSTPDQHGSGPCWVRPSLADVSASLLQGLLPAVVTASAYRTTPWRWVLNAWATDYSYGNIILQDANIDSILAFAGSIAANLPCSVEC